MSAEGDRLPAPQAAIEFAGPGNARLFFSGPPQGLRGMIPLVNTGSDKQKIRSIAVNAAELNGAAQLPLREIPFFAKLYPGEQANVPGLLALDPRTAPGSYEIEVSVGSRTLPATAYVTEVVDLRIQPGAVTILAGSAMSYTRKFVVENAGNVDLPTGPRCEAPVFDSFDLLSGLLTGLGKADKTSAESMLKGVLQEWSEFQAGTLVINRQPLVLRPGQKATVDVEFVLPPELKPSRHYRASLQLYNASLSVDIYTTAKIGSGRARPTDEPASPDKEMQT